MKIYVVERYDISGDAVMKRKEALGYFSTEKKAWDAIDEWKEKYTNPIKEITKLKDGIIYKVEVFPFYTERIRFYIHIEELL